MLEEKALSAHAMAYDVARGVTVLFGGYVLPPDAIGDTWEWDGTSWTRTHPPVLCDDSCIFSNDSLCSDGGEGSQGTAACDLGTDCTDCGPR